MTIETIGLDLAKSVFQAHGVEADGATVLVKKLHRKAQALKEAEADLTLENRLLKKRMARPACKGFLSGSSVCANVSGLEVVPRPRWSFRAYRSS